jgi:hypothetical protein
MPGIQPGQPRDDRTWLTTFTKDRWMAWQFNRDNFSGRVLAAFRRTQSGRTNAY